MSYFTSNLLQKSHLVEVEIEAKKRVHFIVLAIVLLWTIIFEIVEVM
jgi:hypothetical protein